MERIFSPTNSKAQWPIIYPRIPPITDPIEQTRANLNHLRQAPMQRAMSSVSGGTGKKEASASEKKNSAVAPCLDSPQRSTQSYSDRVHRSGALIIPVMTCGFPTTC